MNDDDDLYVRLCGTLDYLDEEINGALDADDRQYFLDATEYRANVLLRITSLVLTTPVGTVLGGERVAG